jgi:hypothetical protein
MVRDLAAFEAPDLIRGGIGPGVNQQAVALGAIHAADETTRKHVANVSWKILPALSRRVQVWRRWHVDLRAGLPR